MLVFAWLCVGCQFGTEDAKVPGEPLGTFHVLGELQNNTCGTGALGSTDVWEFEVRLSKDLDQLFWLNGREVIAGSLARDGESFEFDTRVEVELLPEERKQEGCTVSRLDRASGRLGYEAEAVRSFSGKLTFAYTALSGSDCGPVIGVEGGFRTLPCEMTYALDAERDDSDDTP